MQWTWCVHTLADETCIQETVVGESEGKISHESHSHMWENNVKMDLKLM